MRAEKQLLLDEIKGKIEASQAFILTRYNQMNPDIAYAFRSLLGETGGDFEVVRKRVLCKAAEASECILDENILKGHIGVVFATQDPVQTAQAVFKFGKDNEGLFEVIGGRFEGSFYSAEDVERLSKLPSKQEMRAQFLGLLEAVPAQTLGVIDALLVSVVYCLENKSKN